MKRMKSGIHIRDERNGILVDSPVRITVPVYRTAYGIHSYPVKMIFLKPVVRTRLKETCHFPSGMIEVHGSPFAVSDIVIRQIVKIRTVVVSESVAVDRKMYRNKVDYYTNAVCMAPVHKFHKFLCRAVA